MIYVVFSIVNQSWERERGEEVRGEEEGERGGEEKEEEEQ